MLTCKDSCIEGLYLSFRIEYNKMESNSSVNQMQVASSSVTETPAPMYSVELVSDVIGSLALWLFPLLLLKSFLLKMFL